MTLDRLDDPIPPEFGGAFRRAVADRVRHRRRRRLAVGGAASAVLLGMGAVAARGARSSAASTASTSQGPSRSTRVVR